MNKSYTKASDIYSFGIIMWEILHGKHKSLEPLDYYKFTIEVCLKGLRPHISENTARCYADLMKKCWHKEPEKRPTAAEICDIFTEWQNNDADAKYFIQDEMKFEIFKIYKKMQFNDIEWIPFNRLSNIVTIGKGDFSTVYRAIWLDGEHGKQIVDDYIVHESSKIVALKTFTL
ncbi:hypothetical protein C2G38_2129972, partial [Gigaspora rosea]